MSEPQVEVAGSAVAAAEDWDFSWVDAAHGVAELRRGDDRVTVLAEGDQSDWIVTLRGRRIPVSVRTWRERMLAEADVAAHTHAGPLEIRATLPGLVVGVAVSEGSEVAAGEALLTIEAMKMQNEVRAPRDGTVSEVMVEEGQAVATGTPLLRIG